MVLDELRSFVGRNLFTHHYNSLLTINFNDEISIKLMVTSYCFYNHDIDFNFICQWAIG